MIAVVPSLLTDVAATVTALTIIVGGAVGMSRLPPVRWVVRRLAVEPLGAWFRREVTVANEPVQHLVEYHLGSNDTTMPFHERLRRLELQAGLEPVEQEH